MTKEECWNKIRELNWRYAESPERDQRNTRFDINLPIGEPYCVYAYTDQDHCIECNNVQFTTTIRYGTISTIVKNLLKRSGPICYSALNTKTQKTYCGNCDMLFDERQNLVFLYTRNKGLYVSNDIIKQMETDEMCKYIYTKLVPLFAGAEIHITWTDGPVIPKVRYDSIDIEDFNEKLKDGSI